MGTCGGGGRAGGLLPASLRKLEAKSSAQSEAGARGGGRRKYSRLVEEKKRCGIATCDCGENEWGGKYDMPAGSNRGTFRVPQPA